MTTTEYLNADPNLRRKADFFENFWKGRGPYPILFAKPHLAKGKNWIKRTIAEQHADPEAVLEEALELARYTLLDVDDGIPVARADLGTTLFPSFLGLKVHIEEDAHPWLAEHLSLGEYAQKKKIGAGLKEAASGNNSELRTALGFYKLLADRITANGPPLPYLPDNQGVFDISHIVAGTDLFYALADDPQAVHAAQENSLELYLSGTRLFKNLAGEEQGSMLHGHGMPSGVWFPHLGARISEDSCTLVSAQTIRDMCVPYLERAARAFGGLFLHFCGHHEDFLRIAAGEAWARVINLGNPESYSLAETFALLGARKTVYFGHLDPGETEGDEDYLERMADLAGRNRMGLILVAPPIRGDGEQEFSEDRCRSLRDRWHRLTAKLEYPTT